MKKHFVSYYIVSLAAAHSCRADEFICTNTLCKLYIWVCDGEDDCGDNSDEDSDMCAKLPCPPSRPYRCRNDRVCLRSEQVCNGIDDCGDNSDEENCGESNHVCELLNLIIQMITNNPESQSSSVLSTCFISPLF